MAAVPDCAGPGRVAFGTWNPSRPGAVFTEVMLVTTHNHVNTLVKGLPRVPSAVGLDPVTFGGGDLNLGVRPHEAFDRVQHLGDVGGVGGDDGETELGTLPLVVVTHLGGRNGEAPARRVEEVPHDGPLVLQ